MGFGASLLFYVFGFNELRCASKQLQYRCYRERRSNCKLMPLLYASFVEDGQAIVKTGMKRILSARPNRNQQQKELTVTVNNNSKFFM